MKHDWIGMSSVPCSMWTMQLKIDLFS